MQYRNQQADKVSLLGLGAIWVAVFVSACSFAGAANPVPAPENTSSNQDLARRIERLEPPPSLEKVKPAAQEEDSSKKRQLTKESLEAPAPFPGISWGATSEYGIFSVSLSDRDPIFSYSYLIDLEGQVWIVERSGIPDAAEIWSLQDALDGYYQDKLIPIGWADSVIIDGDEFHLISAKESKRKVSGYVNVVDGQFRAIMFQVDITSHSSSCPCDVRFLIFVSDIVLLDDLT